MLYSNQRTSKSLDGILLPFSHVPSFDDEQLPYGMVARPNPEISSTPPPRLENILGYHHFVELPTAPPELKKVGL